MEWREGNGRQAGRQAGRGKGGIAHQEGKVGRGGSRRGTNVREPRTTTPTRRSDRTRPCLTFLPTCHSQGGGDRRIGGS